MSKRTDAVPTPELDKKRAYRTEVGLINRFLSWLDERDIQLCDDYDGERGEMRGSREQLLANFFELDLGKMEDERRALCDALEADRLDPT